MSSAGMTTDQLLTAAGERSASAESARVLVQERLQDAFYRMQSFATLLTKPASIPTYTLGVPNEEYGRRMVAAMESPSGAVSADNMAEELKRRGGIGQFFAQSQPLGELQVQRVARALVPQFTMGTAIAAPEGFARAAQTLGAVSAAYGPNNPVTKALSTEIARRLQGAGETTIALFVAAAARSEDSNVIAGVAMAARTGQWQRHPLFGRQLRSTIEMTLAGRDAKWESLPDEVRAALSGQ
jgi:hypothetical protein